MSIRKGHHHRSHTLWNCGILEAPSIMLIADSYIITLYMKVNTNLRKWLGEVLNRDGYNDRKPSTCDYDAEQFAGNHTPLLVIGTKMDQLDSHRQTSLQMSQIAEECLADEINLDCRTDAHLAPGTTNAVKLSRYFDKVRKLRYSTWVLEIISTNPSEIKGTGFNKETIHGNGYCL
ncbi:putative rab-like protein 3 isoform X4 [Apostichopus japonicus]|uniref:Putative rab-like protein 3 isoform X4 n=1 Tax=Stichopus japonicus TaxID=307972 RepID=A0A2G8LFW2_STIJA|nr:putative rab-like protein 3 isoform X4 [Apostichopus japonicus]